MATPTLPALIPPAAPRGELTVEDVIRQVGTVQAVMKAVMHEGEHYGVIPGTPKPTLLKPGAEKLCLLFRLDPQYESTETWHGDHLTVKSRCTIWHIPSGERRGSGEGSCSTREVKYAYRQGKRVCPACGADAIIKGQATYGGGWICWKKKGGCGAKFAETDETIISQSVDRVANPDLPDTWNTILKMANKRALIAGVLTATAASDCFTQDLEDIKSPAQDDDDASAHKTERKEAARAAPPHAVREILSVEPETKDEKTAYRIVLDGDETVWTVDDTIALWATECAAKHIPATIETKRGRTGKHVITRFAQYLDQIDEPMPF